jgi:methylmalonyl-CoA carboxyltransferase large subunit
MAKTQNTTALLEQINERLRDLDERLRGLEAREAARFAPPPAPAAAPAPVAPKQEEEQIEPEILMVIAAAVAAFMGHKARIRRVRRSATPGMNPWAQQGRVSIQASHNVGWAR